MEPVKLMNPKVVSDSIPQLVVLEDVNVSGSDLFNSGLSDVSLDRKFKIAGHVDPETGDFHAVRTLKTLKYNELSHKHTFNTLTTFLASIGLDFGIWKVNYLDSYEITTWDILLSRQYHINENVFESGLGVTYNENDAERQGTYQPMIRLTNSFLGASKLEFALVRIICYNGMMKIADKLTLSFQHLTKNLTDLFESRCETFLDSIFNQHYVEELMSRYESVQLNAPDFTEWLTENAGVRSADKAISKFRLDTHIWDNFNAWTAYNILTYLTTHLISNYRKEQNLLTGFHQLIAAP